MGGGAWERRAGGPGMEGCGGLAWRGIGGHGGHCRGGRRWGQWASCPFQPPTSRPVPPAHTSSAPGLSAWVP